MARKPLIGVFCATPVLNEIVRMRPAKTPSAKYAAIINHRLSWRSFKYAGCCAMALALASPVYASGNDADSDGIEDSIEGYHPGVSNGFEFPVNTAEWVLVNQDNVPDWGTSATGGRIEIWRTDYRSVPSYEGVQHAEINANTNDTLFVDVASVPGSELSWRIAHRGRDNTDTALVSAGVPGETGTLLETMITGPNAWKVYAGTYTVPEAVSYTHLTLPTIPLV